MESGGATFSGLTIRRTKNFSGTIYSKREDYAANVIFDRNNQIGGYPSLFWFGDFDIDFDGSPRWSMDKPWGQPNTSLQYKGRPVDGDKIPFIVVPPEIIRCVLPIVMGCMAVCEYNGKPVECVVADAGPTSKIGEGSPIICREWGVDDGINGGIDTQDVFYRIWPGVPAKLMLSGVVHEFELRSSGGWK